MPVEWFQMSQSAFLTLKSSGFYAKATSLQYIFECWTLVYSTWKRCFPANYFEEIDNSFWFSSDDRRNSTFQTGVNEFVWTVNFYADIGCTLWFLFISESYGCFLLLLPCSPHSFMPWLTNDFIPRPHTANYIAESNHTLDVYLFCCLSTVMLCFAFWTNISILSDM